MLSITLINYIYFEQGINNHTSHTCYVYIVVPCLFSSILIKFKVTVKPVLKLSTDF